MNKLNEDKVIDLKQELNILKKDNLTSKTSTDKYELIRSKYETLLKQYNTNEKHLEEYLHRNQNNRTLLED